MIQEAIKNDLYLEHREQGHSFTNACSDCFKENKIIQEGSQTRVCEYDGTIYKGRWMMDCPTCDKNSGEAEGIEYGNL